MDIPANVVSAVRAANQERNEKIQQRRPPVELRWRIRSENDVTTNWTYKRNYKAAYKVVKGEVVGYEIHEVSDRQHPKPVLIVENIINVLEDNAKVRCENIIRTLAKGYDLRLTSIELKKGTLYRENIQFIPYEEQKTA